MSDKIFNKFCSLEEIKSASKFMLYSDFRNEVATKKFINFLIKNNKEIYLPVTIKENKTLIPKRIFSIDDLNFGAYGILEPKDNAPSISPYALDIVIVPGSVFDNSGFRTGYGGGYYDKFLSNSSAIKIGICFDFQLVDTVFPEEHDKKMDIIITESKILKF